MLYATLHAGASGNTHFHLRGIETADEVCNARVGSQKQLHFWNT